ncbi:mechanosensitive ion channel [Alteromonas sp. ASW11-36]|uniref:Mechanosensitive ion channel n=1 Tax=Alteromonas arenosi TaxID=3055817 RepID=A0ABT7STW5_9ALTE|nr:mechanosensitive ion channel domain-containing protein [Alteromonas sp. ASW11-36]MDM7859595.1 mechanosensitive ion channel [Alteromonas sp. ASW11-36]
MGMEFVLEKFSEYSAIVESELTSPLFIVQLCAIIGVYTVAFIFARRFRQQTQVFKLPPTEGAHTLKVIAYKMGELLFPFVAILLLKLSTILSETYQLSGWMLKSALVIAILLLFNSVVRAFVASAVVANFMRWIMLPILFLHLIGVLPDIIVALEGIAINIGNVEISAYGIARVLIFGSLLFWLGRASNAVGKDIIRNHKSLDVSTKEVFAKIFEVAMFCVIFVLLLNIMGINLTALAVFGGALGVGLGLGLQTIASNFISGIIILLDRSLTVGDFVELDDGSKGFVREFKMRYAVLETYDGKDILVPNEKFINSLLVNWTHKDPKQRYRVDFSVAYDTDIRAMVEIVKEVVASHDQVISGQDIPFEERPDCEIDSFGDSGVNMFVEFWMYGIDDGKNRVGGDLLLMIFETLREHGITIPFPQREVRILGDKSSLYTTD